MTQRHGDGETLSVAAGASITAAASGQDVIEVTTLLASTIASRTQARMVAVERREADG